jgi:O-antigen ligase
MIAIVGALLGVDIAGSATPIVTRGEQELDLETLTGRVPLWEELIDQASERPWTGVGFGAFWTPERMANVEVAVGWPAVNAHNGFLDEVLATGLPGLVLLFGAWVAAIRALARRAGQGDGFALLGAVWLGCFILLNTTGTLTQFLFQFPFYSALILAFAAFTSDSASHVSHSTAES